MTDVALALAVRIPPLFGIDTRGAFSSWPWALDVGMLLFLPIVLYAAFRLSRQRRIERDRASESSGHAETMMRTSREWLWAVDATGIITFSSPMCEQLVGYTPAELVGRPIGLLLDPDDLATAVGSQPAQDDESVFNALVLVCRHRDGRRVLMEVSGHAVQAAEGTPGGFEGMARAVDDLSKADSAASELRERVGGLVSTGGIRTAFQPIRCLTTGTVIGAEALSRFPASDSTSPEAWFMQAASVGMEAELELLALRTALNAAARLGPEVFVAVNLSPGVCLDPRVSEAIAAGPIAPSRLVLEVTERHEVSDYAELFRTLAPLRTSGMRVAVDDAGAGFASMQHIIKLKPDLIKLDRAIIKDIDTEASHRALGAAMVGFAFELGATLLAEGIETAGELDTITALGMVAGQGYFLGKPSLNPSDWVQWPSPSSF